MAFEVFRDARQEDRRSVPLSKLDVLKGKEGARKEGKSALGSKEKGKKALHLARLGRELHGGFEEDEKENRDPHNSSTAGFHLAKKHSGLRSQGGSKMSMSPLADISDAYLPPEKARDYTPLRSSVAFQKTPNGRPEKDTMAQQSRPKRLRF